MLIAVVVVANVVAVALSYGFPLPGTYFMAMIYSLFTAVGSTGGTATTQTAATTTAAAAAAEAAAAATNNNSSRTTAQFRVAHPAQFLVGCMFALG